MRTRRGIAAAKVLRTVVNLKVREELFELHVGEHRTRARDPAGAADINFVKRKKSEFCREINNKGTHNSSPIALFTVSGFVSRRNSTNFRGQQ